MSSSGELIGNNMEFTIDAVSDVTIYFNQTGDDTDTEKYPDSSDSSKAFTAKRISIRPKKTIHIVSMNGVTFKNPITVLLNTEYREKRNLAMINKMVIRTNATETLVRIRWHGGA